MWKQTYSALRYFRPFPQHIHQSRPIPAAHIKTWNRSFRCWCWWRSDAACPAVRQRKRSTSKSTTTSAWNRCWATTECSPITSSVCWIRAPARKRDANSSVRFFFSAIFSTHWMAIKLNGRNGWKAYASTRPRLIEMCVRRLHSSWMADVRINCVNVLIEWNRTESSFTRSGFVRWMHSDKFHTLRTRTHTHAYGHTCRARFSAKLCVWLCVCVTSTRPPCFTCWNLWKYQSPDLHTNLHIASAART